MKFTEKLLRYPLPDQLKAVLEKFDGEFDASHLRRLKDIIDSEGITRYERLMLKRTYRKAKREIMLTEAMELVINAPRERDRFVVRPKGATVTSATEQMLLNQKYDILKRDIERSMIANIGGMYR
jgi:hypothetical protein